MLRWEAGDSVPPPTPNDYRNGPRVEAARAGNDMLEQINPRIRAIHHEEPDGPTECITLMSQDYKSLSWEAISNVPAYGRWLLEVDQVSAYEYHRLALQVLQNGGVRGRWTLKSPHHALNLEALVLRVPRRAPGALAPRSRRALRVGVQLDSHALGNVQRCGSSAVHRRPLGHAARGIHPSYRPVPHATRPEHPIIDIRYDDLLRNPVAAVKSIYAAFDDSGGGGLDRGDHTALTEYVAAHPKDSLGVHGYDLAEFGLDPAQLRERFSDYTNRYDVPEERRGS